MTGATTSSPRDGGRQRRPLRLEHWASVASAADLARKATALADRYDALPDVGDARAAARRESVVRLRAAAASAQRLITSLMGSLPLESTRREPAQVSAAARSGGVRDALATRRDRAAEARDLKASVRDRRARVVSADGDAGFADRFLSACDRDEAAGDRASAMDDRAAAQDDQVAGQSSWPSPAVVTAPSSAFERLDAGRTFHQALGMLMARSGMSAAEAFEALLLTSVQQDLSLPEAATRVVQGGSWPDPTPDPPARGNQPRLGAQA